MEPVFVIFITFIFFFAVFFFALKRNKKEQTDVMAYYKKSSSEGMDIAQQSLNNQKRTIEILEEISKKMDK